MDRAGRQNHLAAHPHHLLGAPADRHPHPRRVRPVALHLQRRHQRLADDLEIAAPPRGLQIAVVGRHPAPGDAVDRIGRGTSAGRRVMVLAPAIAEADGGLHQRPIHTPPRLRRRPIDRDRAGVAVIRRVAEIPIGFQFAERRQHRVPAPPRTARLFPAREIVGHRADRDLPVDGGTAAHPSAAPQQFRLLRLRAPGQQRGPAEIIVADRAHRIGNADVLRRFRRTEIAARLQQQHPNRGILAQPRREHRARRAGADDDVIIFLSHVPCGVFFISAKKSEGRIFFF